MDISLFSKNNLKQSALFTGTSNKRPSLKLLELEWNLLERLKGTVIQNEKALINDRLRVSEVS